jgi:hypothetical protein
MNEAGMVQVTSGGLFMAYVLLAFMSTVFFFLVFFGLFWSLLKNKTIRTKSPSAQERTK